ncbi:hypothetical protein MBLNU459_g3065t1 [Dothideomycetes sp. NU459]
MAAATSFSRTSGQTTESHTQTFESTYNLFCPGEESQDWADFLASVDDLAQEQQIAQSKPQETMQGVTQEQRQSLHNEDSQQHHQTATPTQHEPQRQQAPQAEDAETSLPRFHCPWVACHRHLRNGYQNMHAPDGTLEGLACVHVGCDLAFAEEGDWRDHVLSAHHDVLATTLPPRPETPQAAEEARTASGGAWKGEFEGDFEFEGSFEDVWSSSART